MAQICATVLLHLGGSLPVGIARNAYKPHILYTVRLPMNLNYDCNCPAWLSEVGEILADSAHPWVPIHRSNVRIEVWMNIWEKKRPLLKTIVVASAWSVQKFYIHAPIQQQHIFLWHHSRLLHPSAWFNRRVHVHPAPHIFTYLLCVKHTVPIGRLRVKELNVTYKLFGNPSKRVKLWRPHGELQTLEKIIQNVVLCCTVEV